MALKMGVKENGRKSKTPDVYIRVTDIRACKKDDADDWFLMIDVATYEDVDQRNEGKRLSTPEVDKFKFPFDPDTDSVDVASAYTLLKALSDFSTATDI